MVGFSNITIIILIYDVFLWIIKCKCINTNLNIINMFSLKFVNKFNVGNSLNSVE